MFEVVPDILEVTLRDGSYVIDFQFTGEDTATLVTALEAAGFRWIEVGHGLGLNASNKGKRRAAATDEAYLDAAARAAKSARWGMFFIPGIGREEDLRLAAQYRMPFVRIGTNINEYEQARPYIELAKELGMIVSYNAMKSYAIAPQEFGAIAAQIRAWGADIVYVVDSAGTMYPDDVSAYFKAIQDESDVPIGFHGHDNLSLAVANTMQAVDHGAVLVDSSLRGMGRSAGNAITEALLAVLKRRGRFADIDLKTVMDIGTGLVEPLVPGRGLDTMAITAGYAGFHSSFTTRVQSYARKYDLDVRDLIVRLCEENRLDAPADLLERLSQALAKERKPDVISIPAFGIRDSGEEPITLERLLPRLYAQAVKAGNYSVLNIVQNETPQESYRVSNNIQNTSMHTVASVTVSDEGQLRSVLQTADGAVDVVLLDVDSRPFGPLAAASIARDVLKKSLLLTYSDGRVWAEAVRDQIVRLLHDDLRGETILVVGDHPRSRALALHLAERGAQVAVIAEGNIPASYSDLLIFFSVSSQADVEYIRSTESLEWLTKAGMVVAWPVGAPRFESQMAYQLAEGAYLLDAGIGSIPTDIIEIAWQRGALPIRVNIWPTLAGALVAAHESHRVYTGSLGWGTLAGVPVVAGGAIGRYGAVIVDSVKKPTRVIGVADGHGGILAQHGPEEHSQVQKVLEEINRFRVTPELMEE
jgi:4-hydroxy-2-oxovalerate aldolase